VAAGCVCGVVAGCSDPAAQAGETEGRVGAERKPHCLIRIPGQLLHFCMPDFDRRNCGQSAITGTRTVTKLNALRRHF
jgi:hypothetical protein